MNGTQKFIKMQAILTFDFTVMLRQKSTISFYQQTAGDRVTENQPIETFVSILLRGLRVDSHDLTVGQLHISWTVTLGLENQVFFRCIRARYLQLISLAVRLGMRNYMSFWTSNSNSNFDSDEIFRSNYGIPWSRFKL